jgi:multidrug efflux pump subunit AcrA (membrane-fusion protein)
MNAMQTQTDTPNNVGGAPPPPMPRRAPSRRRLMLVAGAIVLLAAGVAWWVATTASNPAPTAPTPTAVAVLSAHGTIEPVAHATIATMSGGVVRALPARVGEDIGSQEEIAEISTPTQTEILVAPWRGTIMGVSVHVGDTVMPGGAVAAIGDLSRYQVETTDVDEYLIGQIHSNQQVSMTVEALGGRRLAGSVDTVALSQQTTSAGVANYPVVIRLFANDPNLRPGMTVRIVFSP